MILLAIDTSGKDGSLALALVRPGRSETESLDVVPLAGGTFSAQLVPQISSLLDKHRHKKSDIAGFAVVAGPGSFTGLRVGLAAIKALAEILQKPIAAVSLLEAVITRVTGMAHVLSILDAGRNQIYVGDYEFLPNSRMNSERLLNWDEFIVEARGRTVITPDPQIAETARAAGIRVQIVDYPRADIIAGMGWERILRGETVSPEELEANYIRRSDAEIFSLPRL